MNSSKDKYYTIVNKIKSTFSFFEDVDLYDILDELNIKEINSCGRPQFRDYLIKSIDSNENPPEFYYTSVPKEKDPKTFFDYFEYNINNVFSKLSDYDKSICNIDHIIESVDEIVTNGLKKMGWKEGSHNFPDGGGVALFLKKNANKIEAYSYVHREMIYEKYLCVISNENFEDCLNANGGEFESKNDLEEYFFEIDYPENFKF